MCSAIAGTFLLPLYLGPVPLPLSALVCGLLNAALVWAARQWTDSLAVGRAAAVGVAGGGGGVHPGRSRWGRRLRGPGIMAYSVLIFLLLGALPAAAVLRRMPDGLLAGPARRPCGPRGCAGRPGAC